MTAVQTTPRALMLCILPNDSLDARANSLNMQVTQRVPGLVAAREES